MFSGIKMEELIESEHSGIFRVKLVTKNVVLDSSGTHFMYMRVNTNSELSQNWAEKQVISPKITVYWLFNDI